MYPDPRARGLPVTHGHKPNCILFVFWNDRLHFTNWYNYLMQMFFLSL